MGPPLPLSKTVEAIFNLERLLFRPLGFWPALVPAQPWEPISILPSVYLTLPANVMLVVELQTP